MKTITITRDDLAKYMAKVLAKNDKDVPPIVVLNCVFLFTDLIQEMFGKEEDETCQKLS